MASPMILICDDEPTLRELMRVSLGDGYSFAEAADVNEALELAHTVRPDLILLDVMMPGGSGLSVLEQLRGDPALEQTPVVVISAFTADRDHLAAYDAGANGFLKKPFDPEELESLVEQLLAPSA
jgi:two-component system, OmpR family, alkaline phosphatase synthesis response regulator PhoP